MRNIESEFLDGDPVDQVRRAWFVTKIKQEADELRDALESWMRREFTFYGLTMRTVRSLYWCGSKWRSTTLYGCSH